MKKFLCSLVFIIGFTLTLYGESITAQTWQSGGQTGLTCAFNCGGAPRPGDAVFQQRMEMRAFTIVVRVLTS